VKEDPELVVCFSFIKLLFLCKEDEACPDAHSVCGEGADPGEQCSARAEGTTPGAACERESRVQPCRCYPSLPEAIAPSLASTPTFARRNSTWCHAVEVGGVPDPNCIQSRCGGP